MTGLPSPAASRAVLVGASRFDSLDDLPSVANNLSTLTDLLTGSLWDLPPGHCRQLLDPISPRVASQEIRQAAEEATDTLLVYYAGHGLLDNKGFLHLAVQDSDQRSVYDTAVPYDWVRRAVESSPAARRIIVLDCCYSARAMGTQSSSIVDLAEVEGTYVLAAAAETAVALAPPGEPYTAFTGALVKLLQDGVPDAAEMLDLETVYLNVQSLLRRQGRPDPQSLDRNQVGRTAFTRNPAYRAPTDAGGSAQRVVNDLHRAHNLAEASQAIAEGALHLGALSCQLHLVRPDGDLVVAAVAGPTNPVTIDPGEVSPRSAWEECLAASEPFGLLLRPIDPGETLPQRDIRADNPAQKLPMPANCVLAPLNPPGEPLNLPGHLLAGVLCLGLPPYGPALGAKERENLEAYALHAAIAIHHTRLRANMQHALVRLERDQSTLRASEESFRQAFDYAPSGMAIAEMGGDQHGKLLRANDALCRLLGRSASTMRRYSFSDLVHPEHIGLLLRTSAEGGRAELRLARRDGTYVWTSLRNSVVADNPDGPRYLLTHVEDIEERKNRELQLAHRASHDPLTGLPNSTELRARLSARLCARPQDRDAALAAEAEGPDEFAFSYGYGPEELASPLDAIGYDTHVHTAAPEENHPARRKGLAVIILGLDTFKSINDRFGTRTGDAALIEVARRLTSAVRDGDTVARLRGDEFAVLADGLSLRQAQDMMKHLRNAVISPIRFEGRALRVGVSFGISWASCGIGADEILRTTTEQMYAAKRVRNR